MGIELTIWAIGGLVLFVAAGILSAETDSGWMSTATFIIGLAALEYGFQVPILASITAAPILAVVYVLAYIALGALVTGVWSWPDYIRSKGDLINKEYARWAAKLDSNQDNSFDAYLDSDSYEFNAWDHKERLATFVGMWPFKVFWDLSRRPAIWLFNTSWTGLGTFFQGIGKRTARSVHNKK